MPSRPTPQAPVVSSGPTSSVGWPAVRRFLERSMPSFTLARALDRQDTAFVQRWQQRLMQHPYGPRTQRELQRHDAEGFTPLQQMARHGQADGVHYVLYAGGDTLLLQRSRDGQRTLDLAVDGARWAVQKGLQDGLRQAVKDACVTWMIRCTLDADEAQQRMQVRMDSLEAWLQAGADPNLQTFDPRTGEPHPYANALAALAGYGMLDACRLLLEHGADPRQRWLERDPGGDRLTEEDLERWRRPSVLDTVKQRTTLDAAALVELFERREAVQLERTVRDTLVALTAPASANPADPSVPQGTPPAEPVLAARGRPRL